MSDKKKIGSITWFDLTIPNADEVKNFYSKVVGWKSTEFDMKVYSDYVMNSPEDDSPVSGICHAKGVNENLPSQWLIYITVEDIEKSRKEVEENNGKLLTEIKTAGNGKFCVIQDPAGAYCALFQEI